MEQLEGRPWRCPGCVGAHPAHPRQTHNTHPPTPCTRAPLTPTPHAPRHHTHTHHTCTYATTHPTAHTVRTCHAHPMHTPTPSLLPRHTPPCPAGWCRELPREPRPGGTARGPSVAFPRLPPQPPVSCLVNKVDPGIGQPGVFVPQGCHNNVPQME